MGELNWESTLRRKVEVMRDLGVVIYDGITLGPAPLPKDVQKKIKDDPLYVKRAHYQNLFNRAFSNDELEKLPEVA